PPRELRRPADPPRGDASPAADPAARQGDPRGQPRGVQPVQPEELRRLRPDGDQRHVPAAAAEREPVVRAAHGATGLPPHVLEQIPNPNDQIPNPNNSQVGFWGLGFGVWDLTCSPPAPRIRTTPPPSTDRRGRPSHPRVAA